MNSYLNYFNHHSSYKKIKKITNIKHHNLITDIENELTSYVSNIYLTSEIRNVFYDKIFDIIKKANSNNKFIIMLTGSNIMYKYMKEYMDNINFNYMKLVVDSQEKGQLYCNKYLEFINQIFNNIKSDIDIKLIYNFANFNIQSSFEFNTLITNIHEQFLNYMIGSDFIVKTYNIIDNINSLLNSEHNHPLLKSIKNYFIKVTNLYDTKNKSTIFNKINPDEIKCQFLKFDDLKFHEQYYFIHVDTIDDKTHDVSIQEQDFRNILKLFTNKSQLFLVSDKSGNINNVLSHHAQFDNSNDNFMIEFNKCFRLKNDNSDNNNNFILSYNDTLKFNNSDFALLRYKINFIIQLEYNDMFFIFNAKSELLDVSLPRINDKIYERDHSELSNIFNKVSDHSFINLYMKSTFFDNKFDLYKYTIFGEILDLEYSILSSNVDDIKYFKRIQRLLFFHLIISLIVSHKPNSLSISDQFISYHTSYCMLLHEFIFAIPFWEFRSLSSLSDRINKFYETPFSFNIQFNFLKYFFDICYSFINQQSDEHIEKIKKLCKNIAFFLNCIYTFFNHNFMFQYPISYGTYKKLDSKY